MQSDDLPRPLRRYGLSAFLLSRGDVPRGWVGSTEVWPPFFHIFMFQQTMNKQKKYSLKSGLHLKGVVADCTTGYLLRFSYCAAPRLTTHLLRFCISLGS